MHGMENFSLILTVTEQVMCMSTRVTNNKHVNDVKGILVQWPNCGQCDNKIIYHFLFQGHSLNENQTYTSD